MIVVTNASPDVLALRRPRIVVVSVEPFALHLLRRSRRPGADAEEEPMASSHDDRTVAYADATARAAGVHAGMTIAGARQRAPGLQVVAASGPEVDAGWEAFLDDLHGVSPRVASLRVGVAALSGHAHDAAVLTDLEGCRVGVADSCEEAWLLAYLAPPGGWIGSSPGADPWARLDGAPLHLLGGVGLSRPSRERLAWLGVRTVGALRRWTPAQTVAYLGEEGAALTPFLHGPRTARIPQRTPAPVVWMEHAFDDPVCEPAEIEPVLRVLVERAVDALGDRSAQRVRVRASSGGLRSDGTRRAKEPLRDPGRLLRLARWALHDARLTELGLDGVRLELSGLVRHHVEDGLWPHRRRREEAREAVRGRFPGQVRRFAMHDPHALRARLRWRMVDDASGEPLPWQGPRVRDLGRAVDRELGQKLGRQLGDTPGERERGAAHLSTPSPATTSSAEVT